MRNFNWDISSTRLLADAMTRGDAAKVEARDAQFSAANATFLVDRLILINRALWELVSEKTGLTEQQLFDKISEIDLRDGKQDGKFLRAPMTCTGCQRTVSGRHFRCIYCGEEVRGESAFDAIS